MRQVLYTRNNYANILIFFVSLASQPIEIQHTFTIMRNSVGEHTIFPLYDNKRPFRM